MRKVKSSRRNANLHCPGAPYRTRKITNSAKNRSSTPAPSQRRRRSVLAKEKFQKHDVSNTLSTMEIAPRSPVSSCLSSNKTQAQSASRRQARQGNRVVQQRSRREPVILRRRAVLEQHANNRFRKIINQASPHRNEATSRIANTSVFFSPL